MEWITCNYFLVISSWTLFNRVALAMSRILADTGLSHLRIFTQSSYILPRWFEPHGSKDGHGSTCMGKHVLLFFLPRFLGSSIGLTLRST
jgi:hypothetical protein